MKRKNLNSDENLRQHILNLLSAESAYAPFGEIVKDFPEEKINTVFPHGNYTFWHLLEHLRLTQFDILDFMVNPGYVEPKWPDDYWPAAEKRVVKSDWNKSVKMFEKDMQDIKNLLMDSKIDLHSIVPNGETQTYLREFFIVANHNSYHIGELSIMRQVLDAWPKDRKP
jgi:hypothetical protein